MMKYLFAIVSLVVLASCGTKVPFTNQVRDDFGLDSDKQLAKVQFYTSETIILQKSSSADNQGTTDGGALVSSSSKNQDRIIFPVNTKCVFDGFGPKGEYLVRFEAGTGKTLTFAVRPNQTNGKYYLVADWSNSKGGKVTYADQTYYATSSSGNAYLNVVLKRLQKTKRKDRVVKGMKI